MFCKSCGRALADTLKFCDGCGADIERWSSGCGNATLPTTQERS
jgi:predicted amidophosphoribosyltransferase